jgi:hypothetical protein
VELIFDQKQQHRTTSLAIVSATQRATPPAGEAATSAVTASVAAVSDIALTSQNYPAFWTQDPEGWFEFLDQMYRVDHVWLRKPKNALCSLSRLQDVIHNTPVVNP